MSCPRCKGTGMKFKKDGSGHTCRKCHGKGDERSCVSKMVEYLFERELYKQYIASLEKRSSTTEIFNASPEGWEEFKKARFYHIFGDKPK